LKIRFVEELVAALPMLRKRYARVQDLPLVWSRDLDRYLPGLGELNAESLSGRPVDELWDFVLRVKQLGADCVLPNIAISITQRTLYRLVYSVIEAAVGRDAATSQGTVPWYGTRSPSVEYRHGPSRTHPLAH
jgi:pyruvate,water dikinase